MGSKEDQMVKNIKSVFGIDAEVQRERRIWLSVERERLVPLCYWLRNAGFVHLSAISVTDWPDEGKFEVTYHLWSYRDTLLVTVKTKIDRERPIVDSVIPVWQENAQIHERELHELFGVIFNGNPDLTPLFLDDWDGPAPFRKDFDWREYVRNEMYSKENERERVYYD